MRKRRRRGKEMNRRGDEERKRKYVDAEVVRVLEVLDGDDDEVGVDDALVGIALVVVLGRQEDRRELGGGDRSNEMRM